MTYTLDSYRGLDARELFNQARTYVGVEQNDDGRRRAFWHLANCWPVLPALLIVDMLEGHADIITGPDGLSVEWDAPRRLEFRRYF